MGNNKPNRKQLAEIQALLSDIWIKQPISIDLHLSQQEKQCLYLSAQGKKFKEIANHLNVSQREISQYRQSILQKLKCKTINSAIIVGIRYGEIKAEDLLAAG
ncbi:response regulator transcription factor [Legionella micdadei]|uniref:Putative Transcriptional regulator, LuxR family n=1 Tax=Legionella micdadei TaxID=451 RepID=A0A098GG53_LEGMI|nr:helix-turn-helix transcriptional regulator [Legionella micdadei]KTD29308.1 response regulator [Legionella micdadei]CEG61464.1 putative Transcriptional regulator, LuxR family [Legionella micdadei]SCY41748.1 regulatory protein, luxR family [Legionella micdadei]